MDTFQYRRNAEPNVSSVRGRLLILFSSFIGIFLFAEMDLFEKGLTRVIDPFDLARIRGKKKIHYQEFPRLVDSFDLCTDGTCCTTEITSQHCQAPCTHFQHCTQQCDSSALSNIPSSCDYTQSWREDHRRVIFVGDSVTLQFFQAFRRLMRENGETLSELESPSPLRCILSSADRTVCFVQTSRASGKERIGREATGNINLTDCQTRTNEDFWNVNLGDSLECLSEGGLLEQQDIIVVNTGLHHPNRTTLEANTQDFISWTKEKRPFDKDLCVVWRQTLPQHFPTDTGDWKEALMHNSKEAVAEAKNANTSCCAPRSPGGSLQQYNQVTDPMLRDAQVPNIQLFRAMEGLWKYHNDCDEKGADCTHWTRPAADLATKLLLDRLYKSACPLNRA